MDVQKRELGSVGPAKKDWTSQLRIEPGQNKSVVFVVTARAFAEEVHRMRFPFGVRVGVSQGRSRVPLLSSFGALLTSACSHGVWPWGGMPANFFDPLRGRSEGVGTFSCCSRESSVRRVA